LKRAAREAYRLSTMARVSLISIVHDDDSLRSSLGNLLRSVGLRVQEFPSASAFLGSQDARETACLILDVRMPGMNGLEEALG
jgi:FixJ family two-component response regulator